MSRRYCPRARRQHQPGRPELAVGARQSRDSHSRRNQAASRQDQSRGTRLELECDRVRRDRPSLSKEWNMNPAPIKPLISTSDLDKIDVRDGTILSVEDVARSEKLVRRR